jgi:Cdc6-like AAA superfamily ATPase
MFTYDNNKGKPIARFLTGKNKGIRTLNITDKEKSSGLGNDLYFRDNILPVPDLEKRQIMYIAGPSGAGKTTMISHYIDSFSKAFKKVPIIVFSRKKSDPALDKKNVYWFPIDDRLIDEPIDITQEIKDGALIIFDDCNTIQDDKLRKSVSKLMADILEVGRQYNIYCIVTSHLINPNERKDGRIIFNELDNLVIFPKSGNKYQMNYALTKYFGLDKKNIHRILNLPSRWVLISKGYPNYCLYENGAFIL